MFRLKKLDVFILRSYIGPLLLTGFLTTFLLLMQFLWKYIDDLVGKGLDIALVFELLFYASMGILQMSLPLAVLMSSVFIYGTLGESNELIAIKSAGISLLRVMRPLIIVNVFIAIFTFVYANNILPYSNLRLWSLMYDIKNQRPELNIKEGVFFDGIQQVRIKIGGKHEVTNMMYDVMIYDHRQNNGNSNVTIADSAKMSFVNNGQYLMFSLYKGVRYEDVSDGVDFNYIRNKRPFREQSFDKQEALFEMEEFGFSRTDMELFKHNSQMQDMQQLNSTIDSLQVSFEVRNDRAFSYFFDQFFYKSKSNGKGGEIVDMDTIYANLNTSFKLQAVTRALNYARASESYLSSAIENTQLQDLSLNKHRIEWHKKIILALTCLLMFFVGAPFGALVRKGGLGVPILFSFFFYIMYYILSMIGEKSVKAAEATAFNGMWYPMGIIFAIAVYFTYLAINDKNIINPKLLFISFFSNVKTKFRSKS